MRKRTLGASGIEASVVGLGTWAIGGWMWGGHDDRESIRTIHAALDEGINLIDTAPIYGFGLSETVVGRALRDRRQQAVLATKCGMVWDREQGDFFFTSNELSPDASGSLKVYKYLGPASIRAEIERSLQRLQTDCIDLYQTHWQESTTRIEDSMAELLALKQEGKIRAIGCSNADVHQLERYHAAGGLDADQEKFSMLDQEMKAGNRAWCEREQVAFLAYSPLELGLLSGKITPERTYGEGDLRLNNPKFKPDHVTRINDMLERFRPLACEHEATLSQIILAWTLAQPGCSHILAGARRPAQAVENARAGRIMLTDEQLRFMSEQAC